MNYWKWFFFSFEGRITRMQWWLSRLAVIGFAIAVFGTTSAILNIISPEQEAKPNPIVAVMLITLVVVPWMWASLACEVKRWHDCNKSWVWVFIAVIPVIGVFWTVGVLGFRRGTAGPNHFGVDPLGG